MDDINQKAVVSRDDPFKSDDAPIVEGEIVEIPSSDNTTSSSTSDPFKVGSEFNYLQNLQTQINVNIAKLDKLKEDMQPVKEMIESHLESDEKYLELTKQAKEISSQKNARKKELMHHPNAKSLEEKLKQFKAEQKEAKDMVSQLLGEYTKETGAREFEGADGELRTIVTIAKLVRKTNLNRD